MDWRYVMVLSETEKLKMIKSSLMEQSEEIEEHHQYGFWSKVEDSNEIKYKRTCKKCGEIEVLTMHSSDVSIDAEIQKQEKANELVNYFISSSKETLTNENILFFLWATANFHTSMDTSLVVKKLRDIDRSFEKHNDYEEVFIHNCVVCLETLGYIPEELINLISEYLINGVEKSAGKGKS